MKKDPFCEFIVIMEKIMEQRRAIGIPDEYKDPPWLQHGEIDPVRQKFIDDKILRDKKQLTESK